MAFTSALFEASAVWYFPSAPWTRLRISFIRWQTILQTFWGCSLLAVIRQRWNRRGCGIKPNLKPFCGTTLRRMNRKKSYQSLPRKWNWRLWNNRGHTSKSCKHPLIIARSSTPRTIMMLIWTRKQNRPYLNGRSTLMETSGDIQEKTVPERNSGWISNLTGQDIIGLFLRRILAARDSSWTFVCAPQRMTSASSWRNGICTPKTTPANTSRRSSKCKLI